MIRGTLRTAAPLTLDQTAAIESGFEKRLGEPVQFTITVDESLLGGFVATVDGVVYDVSMRGELTGINKLLRDW